MHPSPLQHISFSSLLLFNHNPAAFYRKYRLGIQEQSSNPSAVTGKAFHRYAQLRLQKHAKEDAMRVAKAEITGCLNVDYGKTGSEEKSVGELESLANTYETEAHDYYAPKALHVEKGDCKKVRGIKLPIKGFIDLVFTDGDGVSLLDWKTVRSFDDEMTASHKIQACIYHFLYPTARKMRFVELKASGNKDGSPQYRVMDFIYADNLPTIKAVKLYANETIRQMLRKRSVCLPNVRDSYEGEAEFERFVESSKDS
jgi:hypothetical protein